MNKTQIKKIAQAKTWFKKSNKYPLDYALKHFRTATAENNVVAAYCYLQKSFKSNIDFKKIQKFYDSKDDFKRKDYWKLCVMLKRFVKSFK